MTNNKLLLKYGMRGSKSDIFHTSVFGKVQNPGIGTASSVSSPRGAGDVSNRSIVKGYGDSKIVRDTRGGFPKAKEYTVSQDKFLNNTSQTEVGESQLGRSGGSQPRVLGSNQFGGSSGSQPRVSSGNQFGIRFNKPRNF